MPKSIKSLLADLQRVVEQISDENGKQERQAAESQSSTQPDTAPASNNNPDHEKTGEGNDRIIKADGQVANVVIGANVDKNGSPLFHVGNLRSSLPAIR
jgi:hypothetical protein